MLSKFPLWDILPKRLNLKGESFKIILQEDSKTLQEVVVVGYGGVQKVSKTMTASAILLKMSELAEVPVASMSERVGRTCYRCGNSTGFCAGWKRQIWIRGGENILYVIDDVVMDSGGKVMSFQSLASDDIASMSILKDAAATAVYGACR